RRPDRGLATAREGPARPPRRRPRRPDEPRSPAPCSFRGEPRSGRPREGASGWYPERRLDLPTAIVPSLDGSLVVERQPDANAAAMVRLKGADHDRDGLERLAGRRQRLAAVFQRVEEVGQVRQRT